MKITVFRDSTNTARQLGISEERSNEFMNFVGDLEERQVTGELKTKLDLYVAIAEFCNTVEEIIFCSAFYFEYIALRHMPPHPHNPYAKRK